MSWYYSLRIFIIIFIAISFLSWFSLLQTSTFYVHTTPQVCSKSGVKMKKHHIHRRILATNVTLNGSTPVFNVLRYGAKGNGKTDDTKAFTLAWAAACKVEASTMVVPSGFEFLIKPVSFSGRGCFPNTIFQLDGKIVAPTNFSSWKSGILKWIEFTKLNGIRIQGAGSIDGQGSIWWPTSKTKPTALRFYGCFNATVTGITIQNSPQTHLKFDNCQSVEVFTVKISSPGDSPNTDGIHLQNSNDIKIHDSSLACGDDCVSIQTGCSNIYIHDISCGPSHGVSIGALGPRSTKACVSNVTVQNILIKNSTHGVRIKTWQGGLGIVRNVLFSNVKVSGVRIPIMIDQYYCNKNRCANKTSAIAVAGISYEFITGSYTVKPVHIACSDTLPCNGLSFDNVNLVPVQGLQLVNELPFCWNAFGEVKSTTVPSIGCLKTNNSWSSGFLRSNYSC